MLTVAVGLQIPVRSLKMRVARVSKTAFCDVASFGNLFMKRESLGKVRTFCSKKPLVSRSTMKQGIVLSARFSKWTRTCVSQ